MIYDATTDRKSYDQMREDAQVRADQVFLQLLGAFHEPGHGELNIPPMVSEAAASLNAARLVLNARTRAGYGLRQHGWGV